MSSVQYEIEEYKQDIMFLLFNPCFIIIFNPYNNMSLWLHHIGSLGNPCYQCSRACKGSRRRSRSCSHLSRTHWMDLLSGIVFPPLHCFKCLLLKPKYGVDLSGRKTASIALGWCTSLAFHPVTHRQSQD